MENVAPSLSLTRRMRNILQIAFVVFSAGVFFTIFGMALYVVPLTSTESPAFGFFNVVRALMFIGGLITIVVALGLTVRAFTFRRENDLARITGERLATELDERFTLIRNINRRRLGYIDAVLVGPPGVLVFRIVDYEGAYLNEGRKWLKADERGKWQINRANPTEDVIVDIRALDDYLRENELKDVPIFGVVVFTKKDPTARLTLKDPAIPATHLSSLYTRLQTTYLAKERLDQPTVRAIVRFLYDE